MIRTFFILLTICLSSYSNAQYSLVWSDEFSSNTIDPATWTHEIGGNGWGNNESQFYTADTSNSSVNGGILTITAREQIIGNNPYTSARMITKGKMEVRFGKIEARIKVPMGQGIWPAFWMLGANINAVSWPSCGEIDIMEHINNENKTHGTAHWNNGGHVYYGGPVVHTPAEYHIYSVQWDSTKIQWLLDGNIYFGMNIANGINGTSEFQEDFFLILNLAVGGNWPGYPDATTVFPAELKVDYVRVYKDASELGLIEEVLENVSVHPNPAKEVLKIDNFPEEWEIDYEVLNMEGKVCLQMNSAIQLNDIDISSLNKGMYLLKIMTANGHIKHIKFVKD